MYGQKEILLIEDNKTIEFLTKNEYKASFFLHPFFKEARTLSEVSVESGMTMSRYYYWTKKFLKHGLLRVAFEKRRNGSNIKYYVTVAREFVLVVDHRLTLLKDYYQTASDKYAKLIIDGASCVLSEQEQRLGIGITQGKEKNLETRILYLSKDDESVTPIYNKDTENMPASLAAWKNFHLKFEDAKEFRMRLIQLLEEFEKKSHTSYGGYYIQLAIVPEVSR